MWSFSGSFANRESGTKQASSDAGTGIGAKRNTPCSYSRHLSNLYTKLAARINQIGGSPVRTSDLERKKETADVELSRHLRKPGKRNGAGFF